LAVRGVAPGYDGVETLVAQPQDSLPLLRQAYQASQSGQDKLVYAHIMAMMGDKSGLQTLIDAIRSLEWESGRPFIVGRCGMSRIDSMIVALGNTRDPRALPPILEKLKQLGPKSEFFHHQAVAMALETIGDPAGAKPLAELLAKPGMTGYAVVTIKAALAKPTPLPTAYSYRNDGAGRDLPLRELTLASALYRCGDYQGLGKTILKQYVSDLHGLYSRYAHAVLCQHQSDHKRERQLLLEVPANFNSNTGRSGDK
jgi:hypothetical protein